MNPINFCVNSGRAQINSAVIQLEGGASIDVSKSIGEIIEICKHGYQNDLPCMRDGNYIYMQKSDGIIRAIIFCVTGRGTRFSLNGYQLVLEVVKGEIAVGEKLISEIAYNTTDYFEMVANPMEWRAKDKAPTPTFSFKHQGRMLILSPALTRVNTLRVRNIIIG